MSFDPFQEQQPQRDPAPRPPLEQNATPGGIPVEPVKPVRDRVLFPAVLLIVSAIINLLGGGWSLLRYLTAPPLEQIVAEVKQESMKNPKNAEQMEQIEKAGYTIEGMMTFVLNFLLAVGVSNLIVSLFTLLAGVRMLQLRNYGLVMIGSLFSAIPFVSGASCPCCVGAVAGIYAIIMLLQPDIRDAFR